MYNKTKLVETEWVKNINHAHKYLYVSTVDFQAFYHDHSVASMQ